MKCVVHSKPPEELSGSCNGEVTFGRGIIVGDIDYERGGDRYVFLCEEAGQRLLDAIRTQQVKIGDPVLPIYDVTVGEEDYLNFDPSPRYTTVRTLWDACSAAYNDLVQDGSKLSEHVRTTNARFHDEQNASGSGSKTSYGDLGTGDDSSDKTGTLGEDSSPGGTSTEDIGGATGWHYDPFGERLRRLRGGHRPPFGGKFHGGPYSGFGSSQTFSGLSFDPLGGMGLPDELLMMLGESPFGGLGMPRVRITQGRILFGLGPDVSLEDIVDKVMAVAPALPELIDAATQQREQIVLSLSGYQFTIRRTIPGRPDVIVINRIPTDGESTTGTASGTPSEPAGEGEGTRRSGWRPWHRDR